MLDCWLASFHAGKSPALPNLCKFCHSNTEMTLSFIICFYCSCIIYASTKKTFRTEYIILQFSRSGQPPDRTCSRWFIQFKREILTDAKRCSLCLFIYNYSFMCGYYLAITFLPFLDWMWNTHTRWWWWWYSCLVLRRFLFSCQNTEWLLITQLPCHFHASLCAADST